MHRTELDFNFKTDIQTTVFPALLHFLQGNYGTIFSEGHDDILHPRTGHEGQKGGIEV